MKAGRELDALVAEKVMGLEPCQCHTGTGDLDEICGLCFTDTLKHYSTDIAAAWQVVKKLYDDGWEWELREEILSSEAIAIKSKARYGKTEAGRWLSSTMPHAICVAALNAVGHEVEG
jgi:hypothetical protein